MTGPITSGVTNGVDLQSLWASPGSFSIPTVPQLVGCVVFLGWMTEQWGAPAGCVSYLCNGDLINGYGWSPQQRHKPRRSSQLSPHSFSRLCFATTPYFNIVVVYFPKSWGIATFLFLFSPNLVSVFTVSASLYCQIPCWIGTVSQMKNVVLHLVTRDVSWSRAPSVAPALLQHRLQWAGCAKGLPRESQKCSYCYLKVLV